MFLCGLPLFIFSLFGKAIPTQPDSLMIEKSTLGNLFANQTTTASLKTSYTIGGKVIMQTQYLAWLLPALDLVGVTIFLVGVWWFKRRIKEVVRKVDLQTLSMQDYSVVVKGMPRNATQAEILAAFGEHLGVARCDLATHSHAFLSLAERRGVLEKEIEIQYARVEKIKTECQAQGKPDPFTMGPNGKLEASSGKEGMLRKLHRLEEELQTLRRRQIDKTDNEVYAAFLVFEREVSKNDFLGKYFGKRARLRGQKLRVKEAPEPSNVAWENLQFSPASRILRRMLTTLLSAVLVAISFAFIFYVGLQAPWHSLHSHPRMAGKNLVPNTTGTDFELL